MSTWASDSDSSKKSQMHTGGGVRLRKAKLVEPASNSKQRRATRGAMEGTPTSIDSTELLGTIHDAATRVDGEYGFGAHDVGDRF